MIPTIEENPNGLHQRYIIQKTSGEPVDPNAVYFVLRIDKGGKDPKHIKAGRDATRAYIQSLRDQNHLPELADDLSQYLLTS